MTAMLTLRRTTNYLYNSSVHKIWLTVHDKHVSLCVGRELGTKMTPKEPEKQDLGLVRHANSVFLSYVFTVNPTRKDSERKEKNMSKERERVPLILNASFGCVFPYTFLYPALLVVLFWLAFPTPSVSLLLLCFSGVVNRLKIPQGLSTLLFHRWSEVPSRGGVHGDSP